MTFEDFSPVFATLATQLRATDTDLGTSRVYYSALKTLPLECVRLAAEQLALSSQWFPKTSEWAEAARTVERLATAAVEAEYRSSWRPRCDRCDDTGWERIESTRPGGNGWEVTRCACRVLRRDEVLGRADLPPVERAPAVDEVARIRQLRALVMPLVQKAGS